MSRRLTAAVILALALALLPAHAQTAPDAPVAAPAVTAPATDPAVSAPAGPSLTTPAPAPQVNIAIGSFRCKAAGCTAQIGDGVADALATALLETGKFALYERENVAQLTEEGFFGGTNPTEAFEGADVLIFGAITDFDPEGKSSGMCVFGVCLGGKESVIGVDLRIVDARTRRVIAGTHVEGKSSSTGVSMNLGMILPGLSGNASSSQNAQKALNDLLGKAVTQLIARIPATYYR